MTQKTEVSELTVIARAPFHIYYEGPASAVSATNPIGDFDILPGHADFFSVLSPGDIIIETTSDPLTFSVTKGMIAVRDNEVMLFINY